MMDLEKALEYMWNKYGISVMVILFVAYYSISAFNYSNFYRHQDIAVNTCPPQVALEN